MLGLGGIFVTISAGMHVYDLSWIMKSTYIPFLFTAVHLYFFMEARKYLFLPFNLKFYNYVIENDLAEIQKAGVQEKIELAEQNIEKAKEQLEYYLLHKDF